MPNFNDLSDRELLQLLSQGENDAFRVVFERYRAKLYRYIFKHVRSSEIAEEIVTDIFMKLWEGRVLCDQIKDLGAFLHKVGYYKVLDFLRTVSRQERLKNVYLQNFAESEGETVEERLIANELKSLVLEAVNQLPPKRKLIYRLSREEGLSHDEIARALNLSHSTVNNAIGTATKFIVSYLHKRLDEKVAFPLIFLLFNRF